MADNTTQTGSDTIATDDVTTLNGSASSGIKVQRVKVQYGDDNTARDVSAAFPLPVTAKETDSLGQAQYNFPAGFVRVTDEPHQVFYDPFDAALDTTNDWGTAAASGGGTAPTVTTGVMSMATGTVAAGWSKLITSPTFRPTVPSWLGFSFAIALPDGAAVVANSYRFWGAGTVPASPTTAAPLTDAVGFEMTTAGHLCAVVYAGGTRTLIADLFGAGQPTDALYHRYIVYVRTDRAYWYVDALTTPVATSSFQSPQIQTLPLTSLAVAGIGILATAQIQSAGLAVWDTGKNAHMISDGVRPWRKAKVTPSGELYVTDSNRVKQSVAIAHSGRLTVGAAADAATAGRFWLINPVGSAILIEVRRVEFSSAPTAATAFVTSPRVTVERVTFTGTASGAVITTTQRDTTDSALVGSVRTASTGLTLTAGAVAYGFTVVPILTAVGASVPTLQEWEPSENGRIVLRAGQGIVCRQADAGSTSDTRSFQVNFAWAEYTVLA